MKTIVVATDFNDLATAALREAVRIARPCGATIVLLYADTFEPPAEFTATQLDSVKEALEASRKTAAAELERYAAEHIPADVKHVAIVRNDLPVPAIVQTAEEWSADLIAMGTHGRGAVARLLFGSVAEGVLRHTKRPVLTVRAPQAAGQAPTVVEPAAAKACEQEKS